MIRIFAITALALAVLAGAFAAFDARADEFTKKDLERWEKEYMTVVNEGRRLWTSPEIGTNGVACAQCHPNAANTHPETYPKFQQQLGRVVPVRDMINWCIQQPLEGEPLALDDPRMIAMEAYVAHERRGVKMEPGKH